MRYLLSFLVVILVVTTSCNDKDNARDRYKINANIVNKKEPERKYIDIKYRKVKEISGNKEFSFYDPRISQRDDQGNIYLNDYGDMKLKVFSKNGNYINTYGEGIGRGPGEAMNIISSGKVRDSIIYIADSRSNRLNLFNIDGELLESKLKKDDPIYRYDVSDNGTVYLVTSPVSDIFMKIYNNKDTVKINKFRNVRNSIKSSIKDGGNISAYKDGVLFVPRYYPVIVRYSMKDTTGIAYPTPDYGKESPSTTVEEGESSRSVRPPSTPVHADFTLIKDQLSIQIPCAGEEENKICFDIYNPKNMKYKYSISLPIREASALYWNGRVVAPKDTTVSIYRVSRTGK
jgi:hypothetical protein